MSSGINISQNKIEIDMGHLLEAMDKDDCKAFIKSFACQDFVIEKVIDYICGDDEDGWWTGYSDEYRTKILTRVENTQIKKWSKYNWKVFEELKNRLKEIQEKRHIYWQIYHDKGFREMIVLNPYTEEKTTMGNYISDWFKSRNIESNYTTKQADDDINRIEGMIKKSFEKFYEL